MKNLIFLLVLSVHWVFGQNSVTQTPNSIDIKSNSYDTPPLKVKLTQPNPLLSTQPNAGLFESNGQSATLQAINSNVGSAVYGYATGLGSKAGQFFIGNSNNSNVALEGVTMGNGRAGYFQIANSSNSSSTLFSETSGTGPAAHFSVTNSLGGPAVSIQSNRNTYGLSVETTGSGEVARFVNTNNSSIEPAIYIDTKSSAISLWSVNEGTGGAGVFQISNASNASNALSATTNGTGAAASFSSASSYALKTSGKLQFAGSGVGTITTGKVLKATNNLGDTQWADDGLSLPFSGSLSVASGGVLSVTNSNNSINGSAIRGANTGGGAGISGVSTGTSGYGVWGEASNGVGVYGNSNGATGYGVLGYHETNTAVRGESDSGTGGFFVSTSGTAGYFTSTSGYALITGNGNVGIRTNAPTASLDVHRGTGLSGTAAFKGTQWYSHFNYSTTEHTYIRGGKDAANVYINDLATLGNVSVGNGNPVEKLHVFGNLRVSGTICNTSGAITACSDIRYKKDFSSIENPLWKVSQLKGLHYYWKTEEYKENHFSKERQVGFIAQEIEKIFPEMVFTDAQGYKSVDYARLTPVLVEALKELKNRNDELLNKNEKLEGRVSKIEALLERFDSGRSGSSK